MKNLPIKHWMFSLFLFLFFAEVFSVLPFKGSVFKSSEGSVSATQDSKPYFLQGLFNVQSSLSGGPLSVSEIASLAEKRGLNFVILGERAVSKLKPFDLEKTYGKTDVFIELEDKTAAGDLFIFFSHTELAKKPLQDILKAGYGRATGENLETPLFVSVSHPSHPRNPWGKLDQFPDGIELVNYDSAFWRRLYSNPIDFLGIAAIYPLNPFLASLRFVQPFSKDLSYWDNMNSLGRARFGIFSSQQIPQLKVNPLDFQWPSPSDLFGFASNVVFLKTPPVSDFQSRKAQIYQSIKEARLAIIYHSIFPFEGNEFRIQCGNQALRSGDTTAFKENCEGVVEVPSSLPYQTTVRVYRNGVLQAEERPNSTHQVKFKVLERGPYRVEVWVRPHSFFWVLLRKWVPYIIYNPVFIY